MPSGAGRADRPSRSRATSLNPTASRRAPAVSASGAIVYPQAGGLSPRRLMLVGRSGTATPHFGRSTGVRQSSFLTGRTPPRTGDHRPGSGANDVWVLDVAQRTWSRLTTSGINNRPIWTPDGRRLIYSSNDDLWWIAADGSGRPESLLVANGNRFGGTVTA